MSALDRLTAAHDLARDADHREVSMPVRTDDLALVEAMLAMVEAARGIDDYGWLPKNDYLALRAAIAAIEGSQGMSDYLTTSEQHRLACGTCGQRLRDHIEGVTGHAFVRTFAPDPAPLDVERLARALQRVIDNGDALALFREDAAAITAEYTREDKPPPPAEPTLDVERWHATSYAKGHNDGHADGAAAERARLRAAVEGLTTHVVSGYEWECGNCNWSDAAREDVDDNGVVCIHGEPGDVPIGRAAVLALLDPQP